MNTRTTTVTYNIGNPPSLGITFGTTVTKVFDKHITVTSTGEVDEN